MNERFRGIAVHLVLAALALASAGAIGWVLVDSLVMPRIAREGWPVVVVPDMSGLSEQEAGSRLSALGLVPQIDPERRKADHIGPDLVALQRPAPGDSVKKGHSVRLWLSAGTTTVPVPELQGQDSSEAETHVQEAGLSIEDIDYTSSNRVPAGHVIHSTPVSGTLLTRGSSITLLLSSGADPDSAAVDSTPPAPGKPAPRTF